MIPSSTTPHIPSASASRSPSTSWQVLVPITATIVPGAVTPTAGTETWASTLATATGVPGAGPSSPPPASDSPPAIAPSRSMWRDILSSTIEAKPGSRPAKNAASGKPSRFDHWAL